LRRGALQVVSVAYGFCLTLSAALGLAPWQYSAWVCSALLFIQVVYFSIAKEGQADDEQLPISGAREPAGTTSFRRWSKVAVAIEVPLAAVFFGLASHHASVVAITGVGAAFGLVGIIHLVYVSASLARAGGRTTS
jgi:hypothetical protein